MLSFRFDVVVSHVFNCRFCPPLVPFALYSSDEVL